MKRSWLCLTLALLIPLGAIARSPDSRPGVDAPELARLGPFGVGFRTITLVQPRQVDLSAYDKAKGVAPLRDRVLPVDIWYPAKVSSGAKAMVYSGALPGEPPRGMIAFTVQGLAAPDAPAARMHGGFPLIIVSHGYSGAPAAMTWLTENLASKGYVVAAIHHNDPNISDGTQFAQPVLRRPLDIAFVVHTLQARAKAGDPVLADADPARTALIGYSMGGYGVLTVAGAGLSPQGFIGRAPPGGYFEPYMRGAAKAGDLGIEGLRAVVAIAPAGGGAGMNAWGAAGLADLRAPLLVIGGDHDRTVGYADGLKTVFDQAIHADRYLLVFQNGGHNLGMGSVPSQMQETLWDQDWFEDPVWRKARTNAIQQHMITAFLDLYVKGDQTRADYLRTDVAISNAGKWPAGGGYAYAAISPGGAGATWKGFARNHALGLELHHEPAAP